MSRIMNYAHPRFNEFIERLYGEEGCNFQEGDDGKFTWKCDGSWDRPLATAILEDMGNINIPETMHWLANHGGYCDCEILLNVVA